MKRDFACIAELLQAPRRVHARAVEIEIANAVQELGAFGVEARRELRLARLEVSFVDRIDGYVFLFDQRIENGKIYRVSDFVEA